jgi:hypothetical protein
MIVTDTHVERYGAGAPLLTDPRRCLNDATQVSLRATAPSTSARIM